MSGSTNVSIETAASRTQRRRFAELPYLLHRRDPLWRREVRAYESWRLDSDRHPYFEHGDGVFLLARRHGQLAGRIAAHVPDRRRPDAEPGRFGFLATVDDADVVAALLDAARTWVEEQGAVSMTGPWSWTEADEVGLRVAGFEAPAATGRPWQPAFYADHVRAAGLVEARRWATYRVPTPPDVEPRLAERAPARASKPASGPAVEAPAHAAGYADPALVLDGIAAVPDVAGLLDGTSLRSAWRAARAARRHDVDTAVCVRCSEEPSVVVPELVRAAGAAGYRHVVVPWARDQEPETESAVFRTP